MPSATCCADHSHCCPSDLPVCDLVGGRCLPPAGAALDLGGVVSVPWSTKIPAIKMTNEGVNAPIRCDNTSSSTCPAGTTCCCLDGDPKKCADWGCCPMPSATCCADHSHCCPSDLPVCDLVGGRCLPPAGAALGVESVPWSAKTPAAKMTKLVGSSGSKPRPLKGMPAREYVVQ